MSELPALTPAQRSPETEAQYAYRVRTLYRRSSALRTTDVQNPIEATPLELVQDLVNSGNPNLTRQPIAKSSWHLYRSALLWHLAPRRHENTTYADAYQLLARTKAPLGAKKPTRAKRTFTGNDFECIINALACVDHHRGVHWGSKTAYWLQASLASGARSGEWPDTQWLDRTKSQLIIRSSKRKVSAPAFKKMSDADESVLSVYEEGEHEDCERDEREIYDMRDDQVQAADPEYNEPDEDNSSVSVVTDREVITPTHRIVRIDKSDALYIDLHLDAIERYAIAAQSKSGASSELAFKRYYDMVRRTLHKACQLAFNGKKFYRLHDTRSQFSANLKVDHAIGTVATMMGHTNTRTTMSSYGSRAAGLKSKGLSDRNQQSMADVFQDFPTVADSSDTNTFP